MKFPQRIRLARRFAGYSQLQLADAVQVTRSAVSHWESTRGNAPSLARLQGIAAATAVNFEWLATGRGEMGVDQGILLDAVATTTGTLVDEPLELRLINAFRNMPARAKPSLVEITETMCRQRTGPRRSLA